MNTTEITELIRTYFDACYESNGAKMAEVFHPAAYIYGLDGSGTLIDMDRDAFVSVVGSQNTSFPRRNETLSIDFTGENTAVARVVVRVMDTVFTDILSMLRINGKWGVISKLFSGVPAGD